MFRSYVHLMVSLVLTWGLSSLSQLSDTTYSSYSVWCKMILISLAALRNLLRFIATSPVRQIKMSSTMPLSVRYLLRVRMGLSEPYQRTFATISCAYCFSSVSVNFWPSSPVWWDPSLSFLLPLIPDVEHFASNNRSFLLLAHRPKNFTFLLRSLRPHQNSSSVIVRFQIKYAPERLGVPSNVHSEYRVQ